MRLSLLMAAALLAASTALQAQTEDKAARRQQLKDAHSKALKACEGKPDAERRACVQRELCAQAKDPKACEERLAKARAGYGKAAKACEASKGKGAEYGDCMRRELCAQTQDPAKCEAQAKARMAQREKIREACKGKEGEALRACIREQRGKDERGKS